MKTCPVCQAKAFDDALVCYGCLHRYDDLDPTPGVDDNGAETVVPMAIDAHVPQPPQFSIKMTPLQDAAGAITWNCAVDVCR